jgi:hypothetical protein
MKVSLRNSFIIATLTISALFTSCTKNNKSYSNSDRSHLQIRLVDNPPPGIREVWVDIQQVELTFNDSTHPMQLNGVHPGVYNLLALTNGNDTLLADADIPVGTISQIRLLLGTNNYIITASGERISLKTPSAQQSGLKVQIHQQVSGGILYRLILDFDVARSIVFAGNSGNVILKPVLRVLSFVPSGGNLKGVVIPDSVRTAVIAIKGIDTIATTYTIVPGGNYFINDIPEGSYSLYFIPTDTTYQTAQANASIVLGQTTVVDTVRLHH